MSTSSAAGHKRWHTVATLGTAQTLAWASSYYLPAMLAAPMARDLGVSTPTVFAAFSVALVISALVGPVTGPHHRPPRRPAGADGHQPGLRRRPGGAGPGAGAGVAVRCLGAARPGHGQRPVRSGLRRAGAAVRPRVAQPDHRHHADRRLRQHRGLAAVGAAGTEVRLARRLLHLGCAAPAAGPAAERAAAQGAAAAHAAAAVRPQRGRCAGRRAAGAPRRC